MAKTPKTATVASKREINRLKKQSADLWVSLTDVECNINLIVGYLLDNQEADAIQLTDEQLTRLRKAREVLSSFDGDIGALTPGD